MKRLAELRVAIEEQLEAVLEGLRILAGFAQPCEVAVTAEPAQVRCPFCQQLVAPTATVCASCRRKLTPAAAG
jgi:Zn finger protein HypA/HybF involved in hydrogenase expression